MAESRELPHQSKRKPWTDRQVREIAYMAAGAGAGCVMKEAPNVVMPTDEIRKTIDRLLAGVGVADDA
jgi:hypothetical protein